VPEAPAYRLIEVAPADPAARHCLKCYYAELDRRFADGFRIEQSHDPSVTLLTRPLGTFIVAFRGDDPVGCIGLKGTCPAYSEIKRMWIDPAERGTGLARRLMEAAEQAACELGVRLLRLDTNRALTNAIAMYRAWGWTEIPRFNDDPYAEVFFEKPLGTMGAA
jgi:GNAT superfamily N-acetyltransferase